jgi:hypothetical protein
MDRWPTGSSSCAESKAIAKKNHVHWLRGTRDRCAGTETSLGLSDAWASFVILESHSSGFPVSATREFSVP